MKKLSVLFVLVAVLFLAASGAVFADLPASVMSPKAIMPAASYTVWSGKENRDWYMSGAHNGSATDPYVIETAEQLASLSSLVGEGITFAGKYIVLANDIYLNNVSNSDSWGIAAPQNVWKPIGYENPLSDNPLVKRYFAGNFSGGGHTVFGLYVNSKDSNVGMFGTARNATISDLNIARSYIAGQANVGSFIGYAGSWNGNFLMKGCYSEATVHINSQTTVNAGGLVGYANAYSAASIEFSECSFNGTVDAYTSVSSVTPCGVGGICGYLFCKDNNYSSKTATVSACANFGVVTSSTTCRPNLGIGGLIGSMTTQNVLGLVTSCRNTGIVRGEGGVGGLIGIASSSGNNNACVHVISCANVSAVDGVGNVGGICGSLVTNQSSVPSIAVNVTVEQCFNSGVISGGGTTGGIVGYITANSQTIEVKDCFSTARVNGNANGCTAANMFLSTDAKNGGATGALIGFASATENNNLPGTVKLSNLYTSASTVENAVLYRAGALAGCLYINGAQAAVMANNIYFPSSLYEKDVGRIASVAQPKLVRIEPLSEEAMKNSLSYSGFDFNNVWTMMVTSDIDTPSLRTLPYEKTFCLHTIGSWETVLAPTCTTTGLRIRRCSLCLETIYTETVKANGHSASNWVITQPATCTEAGLRAKYCTVCSEILEQESIPAVGHTSGDWAISSAATCVTNGTEIRTCTVCGATLETRTIPAPGHVFTTSVISEPSYTTPGTIRYTCSVCGYWEDKQTTVLDCQHNSTTTIIRTEPTCTLPGSVSTVCDICKAVITAQSIPATGHTPGTETLSKAPTCTEQGARTVSCTVCGAVISSTPVAATGHTPAWKTTVAPTCLLAGTKEERCTVCGVLLNTAIIPATGHDAGEWRTTVPATCLQKGEDRKYCTVCGEYTGERRETTPLGHTPDSGTVITAPTCTEGGRVVYKCTVCQEVLSAADIDPLGHELDMPKIIVEPTCAEAGSAEVYCKRCSELVNVISVPASGHTLLGDAKEPTCTDDGYIRTYCSVCGLTLSDEIVNKLGHVAVAPVREGDNYVTRCERCGTVLKIESAVETTASGENPLGLSTTQLVLILIGIIAVFAVVCVVIIIKSNRKYKLNQ